MLCEQIIDCDPVLGAICLHGLAYGNHGIIKIGVTVRKAKLLLQVILANKLAFLLVRHRDERTVAALQGDPAIFNDRANDPFIGVRNIFADIS